MEILGEFCDVNVFPRDEPPSRAELIEGARGKHGIICLVSDRVDSAVMDAAPDLRVISCYSVGYDHVDVGAATERGIYVTYTPGVLTEATADFAWALLLAVARRVVEADEYVRARRWRYWSPQTLVGADVNNRTLGIIGLGRIGQAMARRAMGFDMRILYYDKQRLPPGDEARLRVEYRPLDDLLRGSDFVSVHTSLTPETHHMIGEAQLRAMKRTAYLINTARGPIVDEVALIRALKEGWIAGAGLDVYELEPEVNPEFIALENVVLAPHIASASVEARAKMSEISAKNLVAVLKGKTPLHLVNPLVQQVRPLSQVRLI